MNHLRIPLTFGQTAEDRAFFMLSRLGDQEHVGLGLLLRLWTEFAVNRSDLRELQIGDRDESGFAEQMSLRTLEFAVGWPSDREALVWVGLNSGVFEITQNPEGRPALRLKGFLPLNEHLLPDFLTEKQRGGLAKKAMAEAQKAQVAAVKQMQFLEAMPDGKAFLEKAAPQVDVETKRAALGLINILHTIIGQPHPNPQDLERSQLLGPALDAVRITPTKEDRDAVGLYLRRQRQLGKLPGSVRLILQGWESFVAGAAKGR